MKKIAIVLVIALTTIMSATAQEKMNDKTAHGSDHVQTISLDQTPGEFTQKQVTVKAGTYQFEINNNAVGHDVGFVLVTKGSDISNPENHIKTAYVTAPISNNSSGKSKATVLTPGKYVYFCPLNPTATDNILTVE